MTTDVALMNDAFRWTTVNSREYLECVPLAARARHLFSTRQLELPSDPALRRKNIDLFAADLGVDPASLLRAKQVHGRRVLVFDTSAAQWPGQQEADALVSAVSATGCAVQVADCVPILMAGRSSSRGENGLVVAAVHAGWRGTAAGAAAEAVRAMQELGASPQTLVAAFGPSAGPCCYQVDARVRDAFRQSGYWTDAEAAFAPDGEGHWRLDVAAINRTILERAGVASGDIHDSGLCTACDPDRFYSYRREGTGTGRLVAGIAVS